MELVEAMRTMKRMCDAYKSCKGCPMCDGVCNNGGVINHAKEANDILKKWKADHPEKTFADDFFEKHPTAPKDLNGVPHVCARDCGYTDECLDTSGHCEKCWWQPLDE